MTTDNTCFDYILVGGGLQSGLMALAIRYYQPDAKLAIVEQNACLAGNHTWSFHSSDVPKACSLWLQPLVEARWPGYDILVGGRVRHVMLEYLTMSSRHLASVVTKQLADGDCEILLDAPVVRMEEHRITLKDGRQLEADAILDNRGPERVNLESYSGGFQKFWGFELELESDWEFQNPIVMDDRIDQSDGFRFVYSLPFERRRVLVEDTRFSNSPCIDRHECLERVQAYLNQRGVTRWRIVREESGVLPMPTRGPLPGHRLPSLVGGYRGAWFHAATGYSFPLAIALAELVAKTPIHHLPQALLQMSKQHASRALFSRFLNRLLFDLVKPQTRFQIFRRFYKVLDESRIARFYGHRFNAFDAFRIVVGIPPSGLRPIHFLRMLLPSRSSVNSSSLTNAQELTV